MATLIQLVTANLPKKTITMFMK
ncbi:MAG: Peptidylprolyl isomerase [Lactobacillus helveticus]|uniref:Uncharacterized protein n=1 Tax=Lactobacillus helveticus CIRM-BIA 953 TaxID=1226335 RepID=U4QGE2_LACHE|nr:Protein of unknown function [Lactobacillus helveticus CIRM-BIA 953]